MNNKTKATNGGNLLIIATLPLIGLDIYLSDAFNNGGLISDILTYVFYSQLLMLIVAIFLSIRKYQLNTNRGAKIIIFSGICTIVSSFILLFLAVKVKDVPHSMLYLVYPSQELPSVNFIVPYKDMLISWPFLPVTMISACLFFITKNKHARILGAASILICVISLTIYLLYRRSVGL